MYTNTNNTTANNKHNNNNNKHAANNNHTHNTANNNNNNQPVHLLGSSLWTKYCTPETNTSEIIADFQQHFPIDFQWHVPT